jgi:hypothetical protein
VVGVQRTPRGPSLAHVTHVAEARSTPHTGPARLSAPLGVVRKGSHTDRCSARPHRYGTMRSWLLSRAQGDVLEVSVGTGRNFQVRPVAVAQAFRGMLQLVAVDRL